MVKFAIQISRERDFAVFSALAHFSFWTTKELECRVVQIKGLAIEKGIFGIVLAVLILAAGGVVALPARLDPAKRAVRQVLEKKASPNPVLPTQAIPAYSPPSTKTPVSSLSIFSPNDVLGKKDILIGERISVRGYARRATGSCTGIATRDCNHCPGSIVLSETPKGKLKSLDAIYGCHYPTEEYDRAIWLLKESQGLLSFRCIGSGLKPDCTYQCPGWALGAFYQVTGIWKQDEWGRYFLEVINKQKL